MDRRAVRIAIIHPKFDRSGGAERYALGLARGLAERGHEVSLFGRQAEDLPAGCRFLRVPCLPLGRALKTWSFAAAAARAVDAGSFDVVQGFGKTTCQSVHRCGGGVHRAYREGQGGGRPTLYDRVAVAIEDRLFASPRLAAVVCPSRWVAREVGRHYPVASGRCRVIPNGVDAAAFRPEGREADAAALRARLGLGSGAPVLLLAATNFRLKGLAKAVEALALLPDAHLAVAGGDDPAPFLALAREAGAAGRLHFLGAVRDMAALYRGADALVHPTVYDPFANVCLEALACGTPVATSLENGASDVLEGRAAAALPAQGPGEGWAAAVRGLLAAGEEGRRAARRLAEANGLDRHVERVLALYGEVAAGRPGRG